MRATLRVVTALGCLVGGVLVGAASVLVHGLTTGLVLAMATTAAVAVALPGGWHTRLAFALGWAGVCGYVMVPRSGGGYLIAGDTRGYLLLGTALVLLLVAILTVRPLRDPPVMPPRDVPPDSEASAP